MIEMERFIDTLNRYRDQDKKVTYGGSIIVLYGKYESIEFVDIHQYMKWIELSDLLYSRISSQVMCVALEEMNADNKGNQIFYTSGGDIFRIQSGCDTKVIQFPTGDSNE